MKKTSNSAGTASSKRERPTSGRPKSASLAFRDPSILACGTLLALGVAAVYANSFSGPFVFDDKPAIVANETIRHWLTAFVPPGHTSASGRPLVNLSLALSYALGGTQVWSYHALNLVIHVCSALTLYGILRRLLGPRPGMVAPAVAFCAALLWAVHPLQTEAVTYIIQRAESLMGLCYLQSVYWFVRWQEARATGAARSPSGQPPDRALGPTAGRWGAAGAVLSVAFCALGMAAKEVMVSAPVVIFFLDRLCFSGSFAAAWRRSRVYYLALAGTWILLVGLVWSTGFRSETAGFGEGVSAAQYWATQPEALLRYLRLAVWPSPLVFDYGTQWLTAPGHSPGTGEILVRLVGPLAVMVALAAVSVYGLVRNHPSGFLGLIFFAVLAPTSLVPGNRQTSAEHRMYLALIPVVVVLVLFLFRRWPRAALPACVLAAIALGIGTVRRNRDYSSDLALWTDTVAKCPDNSWARNDLGVDLLRMPHRLADAVVQLEAAVRLNPGHAEAHSNLGSAYLLTPGRREEAIAQFEDAVRLKPYFSAELLLNLGHALNVAGRPREAVARYEEALRLSPASAAIHYNLGNALQKLPGEAARAMAEYREALRLDPSLTPAHFQLAAVLLSVPGGAAEARSQLQIVLARDPHNSAARELLRGIPP